MIFNRLQTLGGALGSFGRSLISRAIDVGRSIGEVVRIVQPVAPEIAPVAVAREWGQVSKPAGWEKRFGLIALDQPVPLDWFEFSEIPWDKPLAYKVAVYGRDLATGRFTHQEYDITVSRPLSVEEALDEAQSRLGSAGRSPTTDIFSITLVGASRRLGEEWRW